MDASGATGSVTFDGGGTQLVVDSGARLSLIDLTLQHAFDDANRNNGTLSITKSTLSGNSTSTGGGNGAAIYNNGTLSITKSGAAAR